MPDYPFRAYNNVGQGIAQKIITAVDLPTAIGMASTDAELQVPGTSRIEYQIPNTAWAGLNGAATEATLSGGLKLTNTTKTLARAGINISASGVTAAIAAPGVGNKLKIHKLFLQNIGASDVTVVMKDNTTAINGAGNKLTPGAALVRENMIGFGDLVLGDNAAFNLDLSAAVQVSGWVEYYTEAA